MQKEFPRVSINTALRSTGHICVYHSLALTGLAIQPIYRAAAPAQVDQEVYFWGFGTGQLRLETGVVTSVSSIWGDSTSTDAHAIPGDSGSPVYNEYGHLLGTMSRSNSSDRAVYTGKQC